MRVCKWLGWNPARRLNTGTRRHRDVTTLNDQRTSLTKCDEASFRRTAAILFLNRNSFVPSCLRVETSTPCLVSVLRLPASRVQVARMGPRRVLTRGHGGTETDGSFFLNRNSSVPSCLRVETSTPCL